jgi:peptide/nickel transport system substrate-binding protein
VRTSKGGTVAALGLGLALVAAACGSSSSGSASTAPTTAAPGTTAAPATTTAGSLPSGVAMQITYEINPKAVWDDGSPITVADFECTWQATLKTPGSISTTGYDQITSVAAGKDDHEVVVQFKEVYAPYKGLFGGLIKKGAVANCEDISGDFATSLDYSATPWKMESWSADQVVFVPNTNYWGAQPKAGKLVMVPKPDTEIEALKAGEVDFIYPQFHAGIQDELADPKVKTKIEYGGDYEALYMNQKEGAAFADAHVREAFYKSIDLNALFTQIYTPIDPAGKLLTCGPIVPGDYCPAGIFGNKYDQAAADALMTGDGYAKNGDGLWAKDGKTVDIRWVVNASNTRRISTQEYLIPLLKKAGFNVKADNCDSACYFQKRLPAGDYDLAMYISTAPPDPAYLTSSFAGDAIPTEANGNTGQNFQWWNNEQATKDLREADKTVDSAKRTELIKDAITQMDKDYIMLPLFQFPKSGAYRTDKLDAAAEAQLNNFEAFINTYEWQDLDGDGQIVVGAEQWPECLNPVTECANSSWYVWTVANNLLPGVYMTTNDQHYQVTDLVTGEPTVVLAG